MLLRQISRRPLISLNTRSFTTRTQSSPHLTSNGRKWKAFLAAGVGSGAVAGWHYRNWIENQVTEGPNSKDMPLNQDNAPHLDSSVGFPINFAAPSTSEVTRLLNEGAYSVRVKDINGVYQYHGAQTQASSPCEDRFIHGKFISPWQTSGEWMAWGVFDGHAGWETADLLTKHLLPYVYKELSSLSSSVNNLPEPNTAIENAIQAAFVSLDDDIINPVTNAMNSTLPFPEKAVQFVPAYSGSCALLSLYDPATQTLRTACTGDSRAVLGMRKADGTWEVTPLSVDQSGYNVDEVARLEREHPGETGMIKGGRLHGLMVTRAFGDSQWKWNREIQVEAKKKYSGRRIFDLETPPYLTARPAVTTTKIVPGTQSFLIMATDGMWDTMSSSQAVNLVGKWLDWQAAGKPPQKPISNPSEFGEFDLSLYDGVMWQVEERKLALQDDNVAVHLMRNALGGRHRDMLHGAFVFRPPLARNVRDDITIQVVFFE